MEYEYFVPTTRAGRSTCRGLRQLPPSRCIRARHAGTQASRHELQPHSSAAKNGFRLDAKSPSFLVVRCRPLCHTTSLPAMAHCPLQSTSSGALQQGVQSALGPSRRLPIVNRSRLTGALRTSRSQSDCKAPADHLGDGIREKGSVGRRSVGIGYSPLLHDVRDRMFVPFGRPSCSPHCHRQRSDGHVTRRATRREPWVRCPLFLVTPEASPTPPRLHPRAAAKDPRVGKGLSCNVESWNDQEPGPPHNGLTW